MNRQTFLKKLQHALRWTFTHHEIADILTDYESFFVAGTNEGKSEEQIYLELGKPATIALNLSETLGKKTKRPLSAMMTGRLILTTLLLTIGIAFYALTYQSWNIVRDSSIWLVVFVIVLWLALGGTVKRLPPILRLNHRSHKWKILINHGLLFCIVFGFFRLLVRLNGLFNVLLHDEYSMSFGLLGSFARFGPFDPFGAYLTKLLEKPGDLGPMLRLLLISFTLIVMALAIWSIYGFYRRSPQYFTVTCHTIGVIAYLGATMNLLRNLSDPAMFEAAILRLFIIYGTALTLTFAFALVIQVHSRRAH